MAAWSSRVSVIRRQLLRCRLRQGQRRPTPSRRGRRCLIAFDSGSSPVCHCESGHGPWALLSSSHAHVPLHEPADRRRGEGRSRYLSSLGRGCDNPADVVRAVDPAGAAVRPPGACQQLGGQRGRGSPFTQARCQRINRVPGRLSSRATSVLFTAVSNGLERTTTDNTRR